MNTVGNHSGNRGHTPREQRTFTLLLEAQAERGVLYSRFKEITLLP